MQLQEIREAEISTALPAWSPPQGPLPDGVEAFSAEEKLGWDEPTAEEATDAFEGPAFVGPIRIHARQSLEMSLA